MSEDLRGEVLRLTRERDEAIRRSSLDEARIAGMLTQLARLSTEIRRALDKLEDGDSGPTRRIAEAVRVLREAVG